MIYSGSSVSSGVTSLNKFPFMFLVFISMHYITYLSFVIVIDVENYVETNITEDVVMRI